jgi:hypothetical protein
MEHYTTLELLIREQCEGVLSIEESPDPRDESSENTMAAFCYDLRIRKDLF